MVFIDWLTNACMELTKIRSVALQVAAHLKNKRYPEAFSLAEEFVTNYPKEVVAHFMFAKSAFWVGKYTKAEEEGLRAFNLAHDSYEMSICAVITASAMYMQKEFRAGYMLLSGVKLEGNENVIKLLMIFSIVLNNPANAEFYYGELTKISQSVADDFLVRLS